MESQSRTCPRCGAELPAAGTPGGLCPTSLLQVGLPAASAPADIVITGSSAPAEPPPSPAELAQRFPELEILELVGRGGMGTVYKARQRGLDRLVALKILPADAARDPTWPERFAREARALARLSHAGILAVYDSGSREGLYYFAMEYVDGASLRQVIAARTATPKEALSIVTQVCDALQYAHEEGVVHRDIKPENILLDRRGRVKIADFGLSMLLKGAEGDVSLTGSHQTMGTPHYMAPEQWEKPGEVDHRADIYSLGVVFYELLTGELPLGRFQPPSRKIDVDVRLDEVVLKALSKEPELRYQQASQIKTDVEGVQRRAEANAADERGGRIRRAFGQVKRKLDPRSAGKKRVGEVEVPASWPLAAALFLVACVLGILTSSGVVLFGVVAAGLFGLFWLIKHTV